MGDRRLSEHHVGPRLRRLITKNKLTHEQAAERIGITKSAVASIVNEVNRPRLDTTIKIAEAFGVTIEWLCGGEEKTI